jgi:hypothetical protein
LSTGSVAGSPSPGPVVADRGLFSAETIAAMEPRELLHILRARDRTAEARARVVLADPAPFVPLNILSARRGVRRPTSATMR